MKNQHDSLYHYRKMLNQLESKKLPLVKKFGIFNIKFNVLNLPLAAQFVSSMCRVNKNIYIILKSFFSSFHIAKKVDRIEKSRLSIAI